MNSKHGVKARVINLQKNRIEQVILELPPKEEPNQEPKSDEKPVKERHMLRSEPTKK